MFMAKQDHHALTAEALDLVAQFERCDASIIAQRREGDGNALAEAMSRTGAAKRQVKDFLAQHAAFRASGTLAKKLKNIRDNVGYEIDSLFDILHAAFPGRFVQEGDGWNEVVETFVEDGRYTDSAFGRRQAQVGALIVSQTLPPFLLRQVQSIQRCYSLGLETATIVFCRALIEAAIFEALRRRGEIKTGRNVADYGEFSLKDLMQRIRPFLKPPTLHTTARNVVQQANLALHSKHDASSSVSSLAAIKDTFKVVEALFPA